MNVLHASLKACLHGDGGPQIGEVICGGSPHLSCKRDQIKMRDNMNVWLPHLSGLPHLPGFLHLHVNKPLILFLVKSFSYFSSQPELSFFNSSHLTREGHKLNFRDVNYLDDGIYQCVAENRRGMITSATWVHVQGAFIII